MKQKWDKFKKEREIFLCKKCLTLSSRPRATYDKDGICNACNWAEQKKTTIDWKVRWKKLEEICNRYRRNDGYWDVIVPCSGGKDGTYVAWMMKNKLGMHPLCITVKPPLQTEIGRMNLDNFIASGFDHILISPNPRVYRELCKKTFVEHGRPKQPFEIAISTALLKIALKLEIPFLMYGEEGESEYSGMPPNFEEFKISKEYLIECYYSGHNPNKEYTKLFKENEIQWFLLPTDKEIDKGRLFATHWSNFENWDPIVHYKLAEKECGFKTLKHRSIGTFSNYAQLDDKLQEFHAYMMQIKFGFGRAWSDACIEIRAGRMTRKDGIKMVKKYDGEFPKEYLKDYLNYFKMTKKEFFNTIDSFRSEDIWGKIYDDEMSKPQWRLKFDIK
jgi:N-acetyl sugar amidotransferase